MYKEYIKDILDEEYLPVKTPIRTSSQLSPVLKGLRQAKGLSQTDLGKRIGLSQERISTIERSPEKIPIQQLMTLLMALDAELTIGPRESSRPTESHW